MNMIHITGFGLTNEKISDSPVDELLFSKKENAPLMNGRSFNPNLTVPQYIAGMQGVIATLFALRVREKTGKGKFVDSGALHSMMSIFAQSLVVI